MERHELLERLVPLIPPPRAHQVRYHGVLAPCSSARDRIVPGPRLPTSGAEANPERPGSRAGRCRAVGSTPTPPDPALPSSRAAGLRASTGSLPADPRETDRGDPRGPAACGRPWPRRLSWVELLQRVFELDALRCPRCGARMRLVAAIEDPEVARRILACLDLPPRAPPLGPVPAESLGHDAETWNDDPPSSFDQTPPEGYDTE